MRMPQQGMTMPAADANAAAPERADLPPAARRALAEAEARRKAAADLPALPAELGGRDGPEPVRYGDWERKGLAIDF
jgi:hypothetical protein